MKIGQIKIDPWKIGSLGTSSTGVEAIIWVSSIQSLTPFIIIGFNPALEYVVTIEDNPRIISFKSRRKIPSNIWKQVVKWINLNYKALIMLWAEEIDIAEFVFDYLQKI